jgi:hypothetical protein
MIRSPFGDGLELGRAQVRRIFLLMGAHYGEAEMLAGRLRESCLRLDLGPPGERTFRMYVLETAIAVFRSWHAEGTRSDVDVTRSIDCLCASVVDDELLDVTETATICHCTEAEVLARIARTKQRAAEAIARTNALLSRMYPDEIA